MRRLDSYRKTRLLLCSCLLAGGATVACREETSGGMQSAKANSREIPIQWSPALHLKSLAHIPERLNQPFEDTFKGVAEGKPATISSCNDYLRLSQKGFAASNDREHAVLRLNAVDCAAVSLLQTAKPAHITLLNNFRLTPEAMNILPPELAPAVSQEKEVDAHAADLAGESWKTYVKDAQATASDVASQILVTEPGWSTKVTEYGRADFTGDGVEDLLVRTDTAATQGTYGNTQLFILSRKSKNGRLTLEQTVSIP